MRIGFDRRLFLIGRTAVKAGSVDGVGGLEKIISCEEGEEIEASDVDTSDRMVAVTRREDEEDSAMKLQLRLWRRKDEESSQMVRIEEIKFWANFTCPLGGVFNV